MSVSESVTAWDRAHLEPLVNRVSNIAPVQFRQQQQQAIINFTQQGWPTRQLEAWKYSPLTQLNQQMLALPSVMSPGNVSDETINRFKVPAANVIVIIDGCLSPSHSDLDAIAKQVTVSFNNDVSIDDYQAYFDQAVKNTDPLLQLNAGLLTQSLVLRVAPRTEVATPLQVLHYFTSQSNAQMHHAALRIELGESAQLTLLQEYACKDQLFFLHNQVVDLELAANAKLQHFELQRFAKTASLVLHYRVKQQRDASWHYCSAQLGAAFSRQAITTDLIDSAAHCSLIGFAHVDGQRHSDTHILINHAASHTSSQQFFRNLLDDAGRTVFTGKAKVHEGVCSISADQTNNNLLLSDRAKAFVRPQLEIDADDVQCSHGATIGQLDQQAVFYCKSRGMTQQLAYALLLQGYVDALFENIPTGHCCDYLRDAILDNLQSYHLSEEILHD